MDKVTLEQLGAPLTQSAPDKPKIILHTVCRTAIAVFLDIACPGGIHGIGKMFSDIKGIVILLILWAITLAIGLFPLIHLKDSLAFYENGICYNGMNYLHSQLGPIRFRDFQSGFTFRNMMDTDLRTFDVTFMRRPKYYYNHAYMNQAAAQSSQTKF